MEMRRVGPNGYDTRNTRVNISINNNKEEEDNDEGEEEKSQVEAKSSTLEGEPAATEDPCEFRARDSPLTRSRLQDPSSRAIYSILFVVSSIFLWTKIGDYVLNPEVRNEDADLFKRCFRNLKPATLVWLAMHAFLLIIYYPMVRILAGKSILAWITPVLSVGMFAVTPAFMYLTRGGTDSPNLTLVVLLVEQLRLQMKMVAFAVSSYRSQIEQQQQQRKNSDPMFMKTPTKPPSLGSFTYFLFAPTLVYSESYPKSKSRSLIRILILVYELACASIPIIPVFRWVEQPMSKVGREPLAPKDFQSFVFPSLVGGLLGILYIWFGLLHTWMNVWAEILKFEDRLFYDEFWYDVNPTSMYRKWNLIVSNWCHSYMIMPFKDCCPGMASFLSFVSSVFMYEVIIAVGLGFYLPVFLPFGSIFLPLMLVSAILPSFINHFKENYKPFVHTCIWGTISSLLIVLVMAESLEFWSRQNCPKEQPAWYDFFYPRTPSCITLTGIPEGKIRRIVEYFVKVV